MAEHQVEAEVPKSRADLAREKVAPQGYKWLTNYDINYGIKEPPFADRKEWLANLQKQDPTIVDVVMGIKAFDQGGNPLEMCGRQAHMAVYIKRKPQEENTA